MECWTIHPTKMEEMQELEEEKLNLDVDSGSLFPHLENISNDNTCSDHFTSLLQSINELLFQRFINMFS